MPDRSAPRLYTRQFGSRCQVWLAGGPSGHGATPQEAADDLVYRLLVIVMCLRSSGFNVPVGVAPADLEFMDFLRRLGEYAAHGGDIRDLLFDEAA